MYSKSKNSIVTNYLVLKFTVPGYEDHNIIHIFKLADSIFQLTMGGVVFYKIFGHLCCDHINVTDLISELYAVEFVGWLQQFRPKSSSDKLGMHS